MLLQLPSLSRVRSLLHPTTPEGASSGAELVTSDGRSLALVSAKLRGEAEGGLARLVLEQRFENAYDDNLRVTYRMPLPADGAVSGYAFEIGDRVIKGVVDRKRAARERFERAIAGGKTAALLEQERADIFTQEIGNLPPRTSLVARITIDQRLVWLPEGEWELRFPTVIGPRYIGSADTAADARATHVKVTDRPLGARVQIELAIRDAITAGAKPSSPSHALERRPDGVIELGTAARLDRDLVVRWPVATPAVGIALAAARPPATAPSIAGDAFGLLSIVPPARAARSTPVARDLLVLLDTSGSMGGGPLDKAKQVVALMIDSLGEHDRLELIEFSNEPRRYQDEPITATPRAKQDAIKWVRSRVADGGTEMRAAVIESLATLRIGAQRQVVLVTDGYVGGEQQILEALHRRLPKSCRLHVLGVGSAVNRSLATSLARAGRGAEVIVGIDEDAERGAKRLLDRTRLPMLTNVEIAGSALLRHAPEHLPDVFEGAPLVAALALRADGGELVVKGQVADGTWEQRLVVPAQRSGEGNQAIVALYGRERVADVESHAMFHATDGEIEDLGLAFQIATKMTSWVAVDEARRVTGPSRSELVPQELPYGTSASAFGLRGAAPQARGRVQTQAGSFRHAEVDEKTRVLGFEDSDDAPAGYEPEAFDALSADEEAFDLEEATGSFADRARGFGGGERDKAESREQRRAMPVLKKVAIADEPERPSGAARSVAGPRSPAAPPPADEGGPPQAPAEAAPPAAEQPAPGAAAPPPAMTAPVRSEMAAPEPEAAPLARLGDAPAAEEPRGGPHVQAARATAIVPVAPKRSRRWRYVLVAALIAALIAALLWWLVA
jgi:Ca-activated chloride channel homolog